MSQLLQVRAAIPVKREGAWADGEGDGLEFVIDLEVSGEIRHEDDFPVVTLSHESWMATSGKAEMGRACDALLDAYLEAAGACLCSCGREQPRDAHQCSHCEDDDSLSIDAMERYAGAIR